MAARNISMLCVPEGGMNYNWDLTYIIDGIAAAFQGHTHRLTRIFVLGMTTVEHALPVPRLYDDVLILYALSGTGSTPTHLVNYGGAWGEQVVWAKEDVANDPKYESTAPCNFFVNSDINSRQATPIHKA